MSAYTCVRKVHVCVCMYVCMNVRVCMFNMIARVRYVHTALRQTGGPHVYVCINIKDDFREEKRHACVCTCMYARRMGVPVEKGVGTVSVKRERKHKYSLRN